MNTPTRRGLLGGAAVLAVATPAIAVEHPDAELLATCEAFDALERALVATYNNCPDEGPEWDAAETEREHLGDVQSPLIDRMCELRAVTREGHAARARSLVLWDAEALTPEDYWDDRIRSAIVRDLIG